MRPSSGSSRPPSSPSTVVFPEPEAPISATSSPAPTHSETPLTATISPAADWKRRVSPSHATGSLIVFVRRRKDQDAASLPPHRGEPPESDLLDQVPRQLQTACAVNDHALAARGAGFGRGPAVADPQHAVHVLRSPLLMRDEHDRGPLALTNSAQVSQHVRSGCAVDTGGWFLGANPLRALGKRDRPRAEPPPPARPPRGPGAP